MSQPLPDTLPDDLPDYLPDDLPDDLLDDPPGDHLEDLPDAPMTPCHPAAVQVSGRTRMTVTMRALEELVGLEVATWRR